MSKSIIDRLGADRIIHVCSSAKTFKETCEQLGCGYRYLVSAAQQLGCFDKLNSSSQNNSRKRDYSKPWYYKSIDALGRAYYAIDHTIWCQELFAGRVNSNSEKIKRHLIAASLKTNKCECCGITEWQGMPISCQLHHIDGNPSNNTFENLKILCPNCHTQTDNYGSKNAKNREC